MGYLLIFFEDAWDFGLWVTPTAFLLTHLFTGKIYVGYGENISYGRAWANRREDPLFYWLVIFGETFLSVFLFLILTR